MKKVVSLILLIVVVLILPLYVHASDSPEAIWSNLYGSSDFDSANAVKQTSDGGYIVACETYFDDYDVAGTGYHGMGDIWVVKIDSNGDITWSKCLGGSESEYPIDIQATTDGGYIILGYTGSADFDVSGYHGGGDYWVVKLDSIEEAGGVAGRRTQSIPNLPLGYRVRFRMFNKAATDYACRLGVSRPEPSSLLKMYRVQNVPGTVN